MKIVMKCDNGGYIVQPKRHYHKKMEKQLKHNQVANALRVYADKLIEKAEELEKKSGWNEYFKSLSAYTLKAFAT